MNILITGGAGYIGSHTCKHLAMAGHKVVVYDNLSTGFRELVRWGNLEHGDILDQARLRSCMHCHQIDGVIHFAALSQVGTSMREPGAYYHNNISGTICLLEAMRHEGVTRIVMSGTAAVYGQPKQMPIAESCPPAPMNPYGFSKFCMERILADYENAHGIRWTSLRYFNAAGADPDGETGEMHNPETHLIPRIFMAVDGQIPALEIFGNDYPTPDGTCVRDYIHVLDLASAHRLALERLAQNSLAQSFQDQTSEAHSGTPGKGRAEAPEKTPLSGAFNLGTGKGASVKEMLNAATRACGKNVPHVFAPRREGDPASLVADPSLARAVLGWTPQYSDMDTIMSTAWAWFTAHMRG